MIIMGKDKKRAGMVATIMKKIGSKYEDMKSDNEQMTHSKYEEGAEQDQKSAMDECASQMLQAVETKDAAKMKSCMKNMVKMILKEQEPSNED